MSARASSLLRHDGVVLAVTALLWALELFDTLFLGQRLTALGIRPRSLERLRGVLFAPPLQLRSLTRWRTQSPF